MRTLLTALVVLLLSSAPGQAFGQATTPRLLTPSLDGVAATVRLRAIGNPSLEAERPFGMPVTVKSRRDKRQGEILMIVGAAGILTGILVDESLVTVAGAAVGGVGLYMYLRATR